ncbi:hypothetical protein BRADI_1g45512v3 [Brachypodium distachyon]|uniref:Uncharacterized protein n=1 Tax=Brachypodium distachyon TaxID=15368 RepID=A0A2K2DPH3_BRADI|nr:hypothetical protein BRADI_1g45512v3 [Brachypodium distachyon]
MHLDSSVTLHQRIRLSLLVAAICRTSNWTKINPGTSLLDHTKFCIMVRPRSCHMFALSSTIAGRSKTHHPST